MSRLTIPARWQLALTLALLAPAAAHGGQPAKKEAPAALPSGVVTPEMWRQAETGPLRPGEIDRLVSAELARAKIKPAPRTTDEQFLRRVWLDLTGALPMPAD